ALRAADWGPTNAIKYTEMGRYAAVIGTREPRPTPRTGPLPVLEPDEKFSVRPAPGARWAKGDDLGPAAAGAARRRRPARSGATIAGLDYDGDGKPDLFLAGAVVDKGKVRDLLLRNEGGGRFVDVTARAGLASPHPTLGCAVADFDNDGHPDLLLTGV